MWTLLSAMVMLFTANMVLAKDYLPTILLDEFPKEEEGEGWTCVPDGLSCYKKFTRRKTYLEAAKYCSDQGGRLAELNDPFEDDYVADNFGLYKPWVGAVQSRYKTMLARPLANSTKAPAPLEPASYINFFIKYGPRRPRGCVTTSLFAYWRVKNCKEKRPFICEKRPIAVTIDGKIYHIPRSDYEMRTAHMDPANVYDRWRNYVKRYPNIGHRIRYVGNRIKRYAQGFQVDKCDSTCLSSLSTGDAAI